MSLKGVKCPTCRREIDWSSSPFRPFCSERCRMIDLGAWLSEQRAIPGDTAPLEADTAGTPPGSKPQDPDSI
jgi:endogenous inhibitor of DNA gyrase (YacG/DUF329 family)